MGIVKCLADILESLTEFHESSLGIPEFPLVIQEPSSDILKSPMGIIEIPLVIL